MLAIACMSSMMMREYEYCLDTCSLYVSGDTYIRRKKIWMDGDGYRGKDTRPHTLSRCWRKLPVDSLLRD